ncbi:MAG: family 43 glycosylhydrolase [Bacteroidota bacterium]
MPCGDSRLVKGSLFIALLFCISSVFAQDIRKDISVHDPVMTKAGDTYYLFGTGRGINVWSSKDRISWKQEQPVFSAGPQWAVDAVKGFKDFIWAPDIHHANGQYYLYYCVSTFGKNNSAIGVATNKTLDPGSVDYKWTDHGMILQSIPGKTNWNAIDPNVVIDDKNNAWLFFGSFWEGLKMVQLNSDLLGVSAGNLAKIETIASYRGDKNKIAESDELRANAIEAPFIFKRSGYYYLFASIGYCCRGSKSTYRMIVGRSKTATGPYMDAEGKPMATGGGTLVLQGDADWYGVGHNSAYTFEGKDYLVFHGYDARDNAKPKLRMEQLYWRKGWPLIKPKQN